MTVVGLSRTALGQRVPLAVERAVGPIRRLSGRQRLVGWLAPIGLTLLAFGLRLVGLGNPHRFAFDETYYAKDAWSLLNHGYVRTYVSDADGVPRTDVNADILAGYTQGIWNDEPSMVVHPEVGKWLIALGEKAFGMDPFGWRIAAVVAGSLMVLVMCRLARRLTGSTMLGCVAGLLMAFDGLQLVLSRLALLDIFLALFLTCGVACLVADRDQHRARLRARVDGAGPDARPDDARPTVRGWGPVRGLLLRPWLIAAGVSFGLACGTKWTAVYPLAALGVLTWLWSAGARRSVGVRWSVPRSALVDGVPAFVQLVLVAAVVYTASWSGWLVHAAEYEKELSSTTYTQFTGAGHCDGESFVADDLDTDARWPTATEPDASGPAEVWQSLRSLWYYHQDVYTFHTHFLDCAQHAYGSDPLAWPLLNRPVGAAADTDIQPGDQGCEAAEGSVCYRQVLLLGTPVLWWGGVVALLWALLAWVGGRDWRAGLAVVGFTSTWLPWLQYDDRPIFSFYAVAMLPFLVLATTLALGRLVGSARDPAGRRTVGVVVAGAFVVLVVLNLAWFWPIYTDGLLTRGEWLDRVWFGRWI